MICSEIVIAGRITTFCECISVTTIKHCPSITAYLSVSVKLLMFISLQLSMYRNKINPE
jgi:hypothetical protein